MAQREELRLDVKVTGDDDVKKLADNLEDVESAGEAARKALRDVAKGFDTELRSAAKAAEALGQALGPELTSRMNIEDVVLDLNKMGVSFDEIRADADKFAATLKEVDGIRLQQVNDGLGETSDHLRRAKGETDQLSQSAGSSRNALANMVGNSAQDISGLSSSLGVAIGQLAEFSADAALSGDSLKNIGKNMGVAFGAIGGIAAASAIISKVTGSFEALRQSQEQVTQETKDFTEAIREAGSVTEALNQAIAEGTEFTGQELSRPWQELLKTLPFVSEGIGDVVREQDTLIGAMADAGVTADEWTTAVSGVGTEYGALSAKLRLANIAGQISDDQFDLLIAQLDLYRLRTIDATEAEADRQAVFDDGAGSINRVNAALTRVLDQIDPMRSFGDQWAQIMADIADGNIGMEATAQAIADISSGLGLEEDAIVRLAQTELDEKAAEDAEALQAEAEAAEEARVALVDLSNAVTAADDALDSAEGRAAAFGAAIERIDPGRLSEGLEIAGFVDDLEALGTAVDGLDVDKLNLGEIDLVPPSDDWQAWLNMPDEAQGVLDAMSTFRQNIDTEMSQAFAGGGEASVREWAAKTEQAVRDTLAGVGVDSEAAIRQVLEALGLLPDQLTTKINIAIDEQQLAALESIASGVEFTQDRQLAFNVAINDNDPDTALRILNEQLAVLEQPKAIAFDVDPEGDLDVVLSSIEAPHTLPVEVDDGGTVDDFATAADTAAEERNPQFVVPKSDSLGQMETLLNAVARNRIVQFIAKSDNAGAIDAMLNHVARFREQDTYATVDARNATRTLDNLDDPREVHLYVITHQSTVGGGGGGGGGGGAAPAGLAAPMAAPMARGVEGDEAVGVATLAAPVVSSAPTGFAVAAPAGTTITNNMQVTVQAAVIGNRHEVERTVAKAMRGYARLNGSRN